MNQLIFTLKRRGSTKFAFLLFGWVVLAIVTANAHAASGRVINELTGQPLEGVFVRAKWTASAFYGPDSKTVCYKYEMARTDKGGRFFLPDWSLNFNPFLTRRDRSVGYYFSGFEESPNNNPKGLREPPDEGDILMRPMVGEIESRLRFLAAALDESCFSQFHLGQVLFPYYEMKYEEAKRLATKPEHMEYLGVARSNYERAGLRVGILKQNKDGTISR